MDWIDYFWLVLWNMAFMTFHILGIILPTDELIFFFRGVETTSQNVNDCFFDGKHYLPTSCKLACKPHEYYYSYIVYDIYIYIYYSYIVYIYIYIYII